MTQTTYFGIAVKQGTHAKYICLNSIPEIYRKQFLEWMGGVTGLDDMYGCPNFAGAFLIDFEKWYEKNIL
jgi:hypothetical protein